MRLIWWSRVLKYLSYRPDEQRGGVDIDAVFLGAEPLGCMLTVSGPFRSQIAFMDEKERDSGKRNKKGRRF